MRCPKAIFYIRIYFNTANYTILKIKIHFSFLKIIQTIVFIFILGFLQ